MDSFRAYADSITVDFGQIPDWMRNLYDTQKLAYGIIFLDTLNTQLLARPNGSDFLNELMINFAGCLHARTGDNFVDIIEELINQIPQLNPLFDFDNDLPPPMATQWSAFGPTEMIQYVIERFFNNI